MPATDYQGSSVPFAATGRSILSIRREQVHAMDGHAGGDPGSGGGGGGRGNNLELEVFQRRVTDLFSDLAGDGDALSLVWMRKLLDTFLICQEEFRAILFSRNRLSGPLLDRLVSDFFERAVKALDVCNAVRDGVEQLRLWRHHLEIVLAAVGAAGADRPLGEGQLRRARKAVTDLTLLMLDEKDAAGGSVVNHRNRSFGRSGKEQHHRRSGSGGGVGHFRSLSWSVSRSWSAARQLQAIGCNLNAPRGHEIVATNGLAVPVYTMSSVLLFVMWTLVAAIPCQDRGLQIHFSVPRTFHWAGPITSLHERILEESKRKDRKNSCGLLKEIHLVEKCIRHLAELLDPVEFPLSKVKESELRQCVDELVAVCSSLKEGLEPLERQVREVFHRIVRSRTEGLDCLSRTHTQE